MTAQNEDDERRHPRVDERLVVCAKYGQVDEFVEQITDNISRGGIFIESEETYPQGTHLKFEIKLTGGQSVMRGEGKVVWRRETGLDGTPAGIGVKFTAMSKSSKALLSKILKTKAKRKAKKKPEPQKKIEPKRPKKVDPKAMAALEEWRNKYEQASKKHQRASATNKKIRAELKQLKSENAETEAANDELRAEIKRLKEEKDLVAESNKQLSRSLEQQKGDSSVVELLRAELKRLKEECVLAGDAYQNVKTELTRLMNERASKKENEASIDTELEPDSKKEDKKDACIFYTFIGEIFDVNDAACRITGYSKENLVGNLIDTIEPYKSDGERIAEMILSGSLAYKSTIKRRDGTKLPVRVRGRIISSDDQGAIVAYYQVNDS
ncbi:MAG: TIGR02266 family protein [Deltaproteobacteria bacterium]|nr:TIGR02266 family protein [Deltaproteobacteria bacterium]